jgi:hypothetical protein
MDVKGKGLWGKGFVRLGGLGIHNGFGEKEGTKRGHVN